VALRNAPNLGTLCPFLELLDPHLQASFSIDQSYTSLLSWMMPVISLSAGKEASTSKREAVAALREASFEETTKVAFL
jgi:hypothetical protein